MLVMPNHSHQTTMAQVVGSAQADIALCDPVVAYRLDIGSPGEASEQAPPLFGLNPATDLVSATQAAFPEATAPPAAPGTADAGASNPIGLADLAAHLPRKAGADTGSPEDNTASWHSVSAEPAAGALGALPT